MERLNILKSDKTAIADTRGYRDRKIDIMKGILIIFVVMHHSHSPITKWICMFHMGTFFMISGYLFDDKNTNSIKDILEYVKRKIRFLYLPYIFLMVLPLL